MAKIFEICVPVVMSSSRETYFWYEVFPLGILEILHLYA